MCSIIGSFDFDNILDLVKLNEYRGNLTHSITVYSPQELKVKHIEKICEPFNENNFKKVYENFAKNYFIIHMQAPTNKDSVNKHNIHPATIIKKRQQSYLWHNGIIKQYYINFLQEELNSKKNWDTALMLEYIIKNGFPILSHIDGSFACLMLYKNELYIFRNTSSPLFMDQYLNISSTKFPHAGNLQHGRLYKIDFQNNRLIEMLKFKCKDNPYYFVK